MRAGSTEDTIDCLFITPRDLVGADAYIKLANLGGMLKEDNIEFDIVEPAAESISNEEILQIIGKRKPTIICIAALPSTLPDAYRLTKKIKIDYPDKIIVLEGYHINADPSIIIDMEIPYGIHGDAEYTFLELCQCILRDEKPSADLSGLIINENGKLKVNPAAFIKNIDQLPPPAYDYLPIGKYYSASTTKTYMKFFTTRGCPYDCNFCSSAPQMKYRYLSNENSVNQLKVLVNDLGVEWIEFMDLTFTVLRNRTLMLCDAIIDSGLKFDWGCETRADKLDEELLLKMKAAGCKKVTFGVEAGSSHIRYQTGKKISNEQFIEAFALCRKHGIKTMANFILGHPEETVQDMKETIRFARQLKPFNVLFLRMIPLPDVEVFKIGIQNGEISSDIWVRYMKGEVEHPVYYPSTVKSAEMDKLLRQAYLRFYFSFDVIKNYLPLFTDWSFVKRSASIFYTMAFGKPVFK